MGRRNSEQRVAHLMCELYVRARNIGLTVGEQFELPLTQLVLGDALGLTPVHVNRVLRKLRLQKIMSLAGGRPVAVTRVERLGRHQQRRSGALRQPAHQKMGRVGAAAQPPGRTRRSQGSRCVCSLGRRPRGFHVRVRAGGRKVYAVRCRIGVQQRTFTIGQHGMPWTVDDARARGREILTDVARGDDPTADKRALRTAVTVSDLIEVYLCDGPASRPAKRASTWIEDGSNLRRHAKVLIGERLGIALTKAEVAKMATQIAEGRTSKDEKTRKQGRARVRGGPAVAQRTVRVMFAWAVEQKLVSDNPASRVRMPAPPMRERFLSRGEADRLLAAIGEMVDERSLERSYASIFKLLMLTGARKSEISGLR